LNKLQQSFEFYFKRNDYLIRSWFVRIQQVTAKAVNCG